MPTAAEAYAFAASSAGRLARYGSDSISGLAQQLSSTAVGFAPILNFLSSAAINLTTGGRRYTDAMMGRIKLQQEQLISQMENMRFQHAQELSDYAEVFSEYDAARTPKDKETEEDSAKNHAAADARARQELEFLAETKYNDPRLKAILDSRGIEAARQLIRDRNRDFQIIWASETSLKKATGADTDQQTAEEWEKPRSTTGAGSVGGLFGGPSAAAGQDEPRAPEPDPGDFNASLARSNNLSRPQMEAVREEVETGKPSAHMQSLEKKPKKTALDDFIIGQNTKAVDTTNHRIDQIVDDKNMPLPQRMQEIARINPGVASQLRGLSRYELPPNEPNSANREQMVNRAVRMFGYVPSNYPAIEKFKNEDSQGNKVVVRAGAMGQAAIRVLENANKGDSESTLIPLNVLQRMVAGHLNPEDTKWAGLYDSLLQFDQQFQGLASGTGTPRVGPMMQWISHINTALSPAQLRTAITQNIADAYQVLSIHEQNWERLIRRNDQLVPGINPHDFKIMRDLVRGDPETGQMPADSAREVLAVSRDPRTAQKSFRNNLPPLTMQEIREEYIPRYEKWKNSTDPQLRAHAEAARMRIGNISQIERFIPEVDGPNADER